MKFITIFTTAIVAAIVTMWAEDTTLLTLDAANLDELRAHAGQDVVVEGNVTEVGTTKTNTITFINLGLPRKQGFVAVIFKKNYGAFPDGFEAYQRRKLRISGQLDNYQGDRPQIEVRSPEQIQIVEEE